MKRLFLIIFVVVGFVLLLKLAPPVEAQIYCTDAFIECGETLDFGGNCNINAALTHTVTCSYYSGSCHANVGRLCSAYVCWGVVSGCNPVVPCNYSYPSCGGIGCGSGSSCKGNSETSTCSCVANSTPTPTPTATPIPITYGTIQGRKVQYPSSIQSLVQPANDPAPSQIVTLAPSAGGSSTSGNAYFLTDVPFDKDYTVSVCTVPTGYTVGYSVCYNDSSTSCHTDDKVVVWSNSYTVDYSRALTENYNASVCH
jgi:hypothetical protein